MPDGAPRSSLLHLAGLGLAIILVAILVWLWFWGLPRLGGTFLSELSYVVFAIIAAGVLALGERAYGALAKLFGGR